MPRREVGTTQTSWNLTSKRGEKRDRLTREIFSWLHRDTVKPAVRSKFKRWRSHVSKTFEPRLPGGARPSEFDKGNRLQRVIRAASRQLSYRGLFISRSVGLYESLVAKRRKEMARVLILRVTRIRAILAPARGGLTLREGQRSRGLIKSPLSPVKRAFANCFWYFVCGKIVS